EREDRAPLVAHRPTRDGQEPSPQNRTACRLSHCSPSNRFSAASTAHSPISAAASRALAPPAPNGQGGPSPNGLVRRVAPGLAWSWTSRPSDRASGSLAERRADGGGRVV